MSTTSSFLSRATLRSTSGQLTAPVRRSFTRAAALRLREDKQQSPEEIEKAKQESLRTGKKPEALKSQSEAGLQADNEPVKDHDQHIKKLQEETASKS